MNYLFNAESAKFKKLGALCVNKNETKATEVIELVDGNNPLS
jgi:hypothetical protein